MQYSPVQNNIDGQFVDANTSRSLNVVSPLEGNQLSKVPMSTPRNKMEGYRIRTTRMGWIYTGNYRSLSVGSVSSVFLTTLSVVPPAVQDFGSWVTRLYVLVQLVHQENGKTLTKANNNGNAINKNYLSRNIDDYDIAGIKIILPSKIK